MNLKPPTEKQSSIIWFALTGLAIASVVALVVAAIWGLGRFLNLLSPVLWPLAIAAVVACLLDPVVNWLEHRKVPRTRAIVLVFVAAFALVTGVLGSVIPQIVVETHELITKTPAYVLDLRHRAEMWVSHSPDIVRQVLPVTNVPADTNAFSGAANHLTATNPPPATTNATTNATPVSASPIQIDKQAFSSAAGWLADNLPKLASWLFGQSSKIANFFSLLAGIALIPIYAFYFLVEKRGIMSHWRDYLPIRNSHLKDELIFLLNAINQYLVAFFRGQVLVAMCNGILYTIGFLAIGLNYAFLVGLMAVGLTMIPFLGAIIICITALTLAFVQYGDWTHPLMVLGVVAIVQTIESLFISPKIMGNRVGLHPVVIIIAVMTGTTLLGGLLGGILAIPLAAALRVVMFRYVWKKRGE